MSFKAMCLEIDEAAVKEAPAPVAVKQTRGKTTWHSVLCIVVSVFWFAFLIVFFVFCVMHPLNYADAVAIQRNYETVPHPPRIHQLKRVLKVVPQVVEQKFVEPVDIKFLTNPSIFDRAAMRVKVTHKLPVQAVAATAFEGALQISTALVTVTNHVDAKVTTHVPVPVETYTQWMLFMQSMSLVKPVEKIKTSAPPPPCVCPRDDEKHSNKTSSDIAVESTGAIVFNGVRFAMELVGTVFVGVVVFAAIAGTGVGSE